MNQAEIKRYLAVIKRAVALIEGQLEDDGGLLDKLETEVMAQSLPPAPQAIPAPVVEPEIVPQTKNLTPVTAVQETITDEEQTMFLMARKKHISDLMEIDCWPEAVSASFTAEATDTDQINRANNVLDMILDRPIEGAHFLDFGCGDGWIAKQAKSRGVTTATGYDIKLSKNWSKLPGPTFTHIFNELKRDFYDVIVLYDVLDHAEDPIDVMDKVKMLVKKNGIIYVRCHPWTAKHATHVFKQGLNKAYIHLYLSYEEIKDITKQPPMYTRIERNPIEAYHWWFHNFEIKKETVIREPVSDFFHVESFKDLIMNEQELQKWNVDIEDFLKFMEYQFVDYVLTPKKA